MLGESGPAVFCSVPANPVCVSPPARLKPSRYVSLCDATTAALSRAASLKSVCACGPECGRAMSYGKENVIWNLRDRVTSRLNWSFLSSFCFIIIIFLPQTNRQNTPLYKTFKSNLKTWGSLKKTSCYAWGKTTVTLNLRVGISELCHKTDLKCDFNRGELAGTDARFCLLYFCPVRRLFQ